MDSTPEGEKLMEAIFDRQRKSVESQESKKLYIDPQESKRLTNDSKITTHKRIGSFNRGKDTRPISSVQPPFDKNRLSNRLSQSPHLMVLKTNVISRPVEFNTYALPSANRDLEGVKDLSDLVITKKMVLEH